MPKRRAVHARQTESSPNADKRVLRSTRHLDADMYLQEMSVRKFFGATNLPRLPARKGLERLLQQLVKWKGIDSDHESN